MYQFLLLHSVSMDQTGLRLPGVTEPPAKIICVVG